MLPIGELRAFPRLALEQWVQLWQRCYSSAYGGEDDAEYKYLMVDVQDARDDASLLQALTKLFKWKDKIQARWGPKIVSVTFQNWTRMKASNDIPTLWPNGLVFNVFLLHAATNGKRPIIDQHSWRGYCYLTNRNQRPEFPTNRAMALRLYEEYERWFCAKLASGLEARQLDKALMAFGQFCKQFTPLIDAHLAGDY